MGDFVLALWGRPVLSDTWMLSSRMLRNLNEKFAFVVSDREVGSVTILTSLLIRFEHAGDQEVVLEFYGDGLVCKGFGDREDQLSATWCKSKIRRHHGRC